MSNNNNDGKEDSSLKEDLFRGELFKLPSIILSLFEKDYPILVHTTEDTKNYVPEKLSLYHHYERRVNELNKSLEEAGLEEKKITLKKYNSILNTLKELETNNEIISLKNLIPDERVYLRYEYARIIKSFNPSFRQLGDDYEFVRDEGLPEGIDRIFGASIYILMKGNRTRSMRTVLNEIDEKKKKFIPALTVQPIDEAELRRRVKDVNWRGDLATFNRQILANDTFSLRVYFRDIIDYLETMYYRRCPNDECAKFVLTPTDDPENPFVEIDKHKELKQAQKWYVASFKKAISDKKLNHPILKVPEKDRTKAEYLKIRNSLKEKYFRCECGADLKKQRLFEMGDFVFSFLIGISANKPTILLGYPDIKETSIFMGKETENRFLLNNSCSI